MGRNKRNPVDLTRTKVWFSEASKAFGGETAYGFWKKFDKKTGSLTKWSNYFSGKCVPKYLDGAGAVPMLAKVKPGTDTVFNALFWRVLKKDWPTETELIKEFSNLGGAFSILPKVMLDGGFRDNKDAYGRIPMGDVFDQLKKDCDGDFFTLQAIVLLFVWAKDAHSNYWDMCCDLYRELLPKLILEMDMPFKDEIFNHTDNLAEKIDPRFINDQGHFPQKWHDEIPRFHSLLSDHYLSCIKTQRKYLLLPVELFSDELLKGFCYDVAAEICNDEPMLLNSRELWKPMSWALAKMYHQGFVGKKYSSDKFLEILNDEIKLFIDEGNGAVKTGDDFHIIFQS